MRKLLLIALLTATSASAVWTDQIGAGYTQKRAYDSGVSKGKSQCLKWGLAYDRTLRITTPYRVTNSLGLPVWEWKLWSNCS